MQPSALTSNDDLSNVNQTMSLEIPNPTDEFLLYSIAAKQETALLELYNRYKRSVYSLAIRILRTDEDAEETCQDVFVKIWNKALEYAPHKGKVITWILTIAHHSAIDALRRRNARATLPIFDEELERLPDLNQAPDPLEQNLIQSAIATLEPNERICIELAYFEGLSHAQLAIRLGQPLGSIKTHIRVGLKKLRQQLGDW